jgi:hypothetical protein
MRTSIKSKLLALLIPTALILNGCESTDYDDEDSGIVVNTNKVSSTPSSSSSGSSSSYKPNNSEPEAPKTKSLEVKLLAPSNESTNSLSLSVYAEARNLVEGRAYSARIITDKGRGVYDRIVEEKFDLPIFTPASGETSKIIGKTLSLSSSKYSGLREFGFALGVEVTDSIGNIARTKEIRVYTN